MSALLEVNNLKVHFPVKHGVFSRVRKSLTLCAWNTNPACVDTLFADCYCAPSLRRSNGL